jgi:hypothetical protein
MNFETLSNQFNSILTQYQNTYQDYINSLDTSNNSLMTISNASLNGTQISVTPSSTVEACQSSCSANTSCSGATFNSTNNNCTLNSGNGSVTSTTNNTAIVQQNLYYSYQLQQLNNQLMSINQEMMENAKNNTALYNTNKQQTQQMSNIIQQNYNVLAGERAEINRMIDEYATINAAYDNGTITVNSNYTNYIVLLLITILLVFLLIKFSVTGDQRGGSKNNFKLEAGFLLSIMIVFLGLSKVYNNYNIYIFVSILLIAYIISKLKLVNH